MSLLEPSGTAPLARSVPTTNPVSSPMQAAGTPPTQAVPGDGDDSAGGALGRKGSRGEAAPGRPAAIRLLIGIVLFAFVAIGGVYLAAYPGPTSVDNLANRILPVEYSVHWLTYATDLGRPRVVIPGVVACAVLAFLWDRRRSITCLVAPACAIGLTEYLAKPAVGRLYGGSLSYPSGHMTSVAALVAVFVLAVRPRWRWSAAVLGVVVDLLVGTTLILLRWHYLTDVLAGAAVAIGTTLFVDTLVHLYPGRIWALEPARSSGDSHRSPRQVR